MKFQLHGQVVFKSGHVKDFLDQVEYDSEEECRETVEHVRGRFADMLAKGVAGYVHIATCIYRAEDISMLDLRYHCI